MRKNNLLDILIAGTAILLTMMLLMTSCKHEAEVVPKSSDDGNNSGGGGNNGSGSDCDPNTVYFQNTILPCYKEIARAATVTMQTIRKTVCNSPITPTSWLQPRFSPATLPIVSYSKY